jgi:RNA polymerase sigma-70 factor (ECF subfamily)
MLSSESDLEQLTIDAAGYAATVAAIEEIPESYQATVRLLYVEGFSMVEAAESLSLNLNTLKTRSFRGRQALAGLLRAKGESR